MLMTIQANGRSLDKAFAKVLCLRRKTSMNNILERFDQLVEPTKENTLIAWLERASFAFLILMTLAAPHSIADITSASMIRSVAAILPISILSNVRTRPHFTLPNWAR